MTTKTTNGPPDEPAAVDLACPLCNYDLRGLTEPRCPECGFAFTWVELLDAKRDRHPYLFEHARRPWSPRRRAFRLTVWRAGVRPLKFWRDVVPNNPIRVRWLVIYWAIVNLPLVLLTTLAMTLSTVRDAQSIAVQRASYQPMPGHPGRFGNPYAGADSVTQSQLDEWFPRPLTTAFAKEVWLYYLWPPQGPLIAVAAMAMVWPWLTAGALLVFQISLRRPKVNAAHVLRAAIYAGDVGLLSIVTSLVVYGPATMTEPLVAWLPAVVRTWVQGEGLLSTRLGQPFTRGPLNVCGVPILVVVVAAFAAVTTVRLAIAYHRYMRFDRPVATVVAAQAIVMLVVVVAILQLTRSV